ncbi:hypothetical protein RRG08_040825 [Elysia crispata]|uniref:Uncharacterized protein n=1 Tax=Elysia crispata TaxID=231223 RepID=A0AAE0Z922_9GAST|nr:hypothetical protein RRG08_040825 [Elysia crispata]
MTRSGKLCIFQSVSSLEISQIHLRCENLARPSQPINVQTSLMFSLCRDSKFHSARMRILPLRRLKKGRYWRYSAQNVRLQRVRIEFGTHFTLHIHGGGRDSNQWKDICCDTMA